MVANRGGGVKGFFEQWESLSPVQMRCCELAELAIEEAAPILLEEGGITALLNGLAVFLHGEVLPAPLVLHLEDKFAKIKAVKVG